MAVRARRSAALAVRSHHSTLKTRVYRAATSPAAKMAYVTIGAMGLAALAMAIIGPRRFQSGRCATPCPIKRKSSGTKPSRSARN
jgi:hypothetical protein